MASRGIRNFSECHLRVATPQKKVAGCDKILFVEHGCEIAPRSRGGGNPQSGPLDDIVRRK